LAYSIQGSLAQQADEGDELGEAPGLICAAREAKQVDLVAFFEAFAQEPVSAAHAAAQPDAQGAGQKAQPSAEFGGDSQLVVHLLRDARGVAGERGAPQFDDVGDVLLIGLIPGAVEEAHEPFHAVPAVMEGSPARAYP
jgi:hypothetical protein